MADTTIGNWFDKVFFDAHGEPCAGGSLYFYQTGTNVPCGVTTAGGVLLGACVRLDDDGRPVEDFRFYADRSYRVVLKDADGAVVKQIDDVCIAQTEGGGMLNPMAALGDLIVGGEDGVPSRLGVGSAGQVPTAQADGSIAWEDTRGFGKVSAASGDASASYLDNKLDVTTPLEKEVTTGQHNVKRVKLSVSAGDAAGKVLTTTDNGLGVLVPTWQTPTGMENPMTAKADIIVGGASGAPDKLAAPANASFLRAYKNSSNENVVNWSKLSAGSGVSITDAGTQVTISADAQSGDHKLLVSATDAAAGYLGAKLTAGSNVTLTPQTDGDGVQTLEISAAGGGGGGGASGSSVWSVLPTDNLPSTAYASGSSRKTVVHKMFVSTITPKSVAFALTRNSANYPMDVSVGIYTSGRQLCYFGSATYSTYSIDLTWDSSGAPLFNIPVSAVATAPKTEFDNGEIVWLAITILWHGSGAPSYRCAQGIKTSIYSSSNVTINLTMLPTPGGAILDYTPCVGILG